MDPGVRTRARRVDVRRVRARALERAVVPNRWLAGQTRNRLLLPKRAILGRFTIVICRRYAQHRACSAQNGSDGSDDATRADAAAATCPRRRKLNRRRRRCRRWRGRRHRSRRTSLRQVTTRVRRTDEAATAVVAAIRVHVHERPSRSVRVRLRSEERGGAHAVQRIRRRGRPGPRDEVAPPVGDWAHWFSGRAGARHTYHNYSCGGANGPSSTVTESGSTANASSQNGSQTRSAFTSSSASAASSSGSSAR